MFRTLSKSVLAVALALALSGAPVLAGDRAAPKPHPGTLHVLTVGVARAAVGKKKAILRGADQNAIDVAAFFRKQEGRLYEHVTVDKLVNEHATRANILAALDRLEDAFRPGDMAVVHISAHGGESHGHWLMAAYDCPWGNGSDAYVTEQELRQRLEKLPGRVLLILDSCHSGAFGDGVSNRAVKGQAGLVVYAAALSDQYGWYDNGLDHGYFTHALLEGLSGKADANHDGLVTLAEIDAYVANRVAALTPWSKKACLERGLPAEDQTPTLSKPATISDTTPIAVVVGKDG